MATWKLPAEALAALADIDKAVQSLYATLTDLRDDWNSRSEKWQDSDYGRDIDTWITSVDELAEAIETAVADIETEPS